MKKPLSKNKLIGLTMKEGLDLIKRHENGDFQAYICIKQIKQVSTFKANKRYHEHNKEGKRIYHTATNTYMIFPKDKSLEMDSFIIDVAMETSQADNWSFSGYVNTITLNVYYLISDHLQKGNRGNKYLFESVKKDVEYKEGELSKRDKRFTL